jgi:hypothetical protein
MMCLFMSIYIIKKMMFVDICSSYLHFPSLTNTYPPIWMWKRHMLCAFSCLIWYLCYKFFEWCLCFSCENWNTNWMWSQNFKHWFNDKLKQCNMVTRNWNLNNSIIIWNKIQYGHKELKLNNSIKNWNNSSIGLWWIWNIHLMRNWNT